MKNLIERIIEDLKIEKQKCFEEIDYPLSQVDRLEGRILAYKDVLNVFKDYNIITAPKSIKLSEILNKIQERSDVRIYLDKEHENIGYFEFNEDWKQNTWQPFVTFKDMKIIRIYIPMAEFTKWLYTLWIAGTEIIDDLKENE